MSELNPARRGMDGRNFTSRAGVTAAEMMGLSMTDEATTSGTEHAAGISGCFPSCW
ncbi:MAG TPA: hypothetical protein VNT27_01810 [Propionibacteriaceae bacterium]|nr:hypothetical protein [Propionibacteriaceae bacterium]